MRYARSPARPDPGSRIPDAGSPAHPGGREQGARSKEQGVGSREEAPARYWMLDTRCWIRPPARAREQEAAATRPDARYEMRDPAPAPALSFRVRSPACPRVAEGEAGRATSRGIPRRCEHMGIPRTIFGGPRGSRSTRSLCSLEQGGSLDSRRRRSLEMVFSSSGRESSAYRRRPRSRRMPTSHSSGRTRARTSHGVASVCQDVASSSKRCARQHEEWHRHEVRKVEGREMIFETLKRLFETVRPRFLQ